MPASSIKGKRASDSGAEPLGFRPLYGQVRELLVNRLIDGSWPPGMLLPSEMQLAAELGVSQGTVRKALDAMAADNLVIRQQGRGTFVAEPEDGRMLFQFFRFGSDDGRRGLPDSTVIAVRRTGGNGEECRKLALAPGAYVWRIDRTRQLNGRTLIVERITLPANRFAGLDEIDPIPNNVYGLYSQHFGQTIARAEEELKAVAATAADTRHLGCAAGTPLLQITRIGYGLDDAPVEWRVSRCLTDGFHYSVSLK